MLILTAVIYGIGGAVLIGMSFYGSLQLEEEQTMRSYRSMRSTLMLINNVSVQSSESDIANTLHRINEQSNEWESLQLFTNQKMLFTSGNELYARDLVESCSDETCATKLLNDKNGVYLQITSSFDAGESTLYLNALRDVSGLYKLRDTQIKIYKTFFIIVVTLSALISFITAHVLTKPQRHLSRVSRLIADGNLSIRANVHSGDEMEQLADNFNIMAESLTQKIQALEDAMAQQERFMGSFAHELKTPMTSMIGYADLLRSCELPPSEQRMCAEYIFKEGRRLERLSFKLLDLIVLKKQDFELSDSSPSRLLQDATATINEKLKNNNVSLKITIQNGSCLLESDLVKSLILNLIDNSIKSMENGGSIHIVQSMLVDGCRFLFADNGRGIPKDDLEKITEAFYRVDKSRSRKQGGAGLGLSLCAEIVRLHNGSIDFYSEVGKGTLIDVKLKGTVK